MPRSAHDTCGVSAGAAAALTFVNLYRYCAQTLEGVALGHDSTVWDVAFDPTGKLMASVSDDQCVKVWRCEFKDGEPFFRLDATLSGYHNRSIFGMSWSSTGAIATACGMRLLVCWLCMPELLELLVLYSLCISHNAFRNSGAGSIASLKTRAKTVCAQVTTLYACLRSSRGRG